MIDKKLLKKRVCLLSETKLSLLLHPLSRESGFLRRIGGISRQETDGDGKHPPVRKKMKKVLGWNGKGITFAVRFREENR